MSRKYPLSDLKCPVCSARHPQYLANIRLMNPVGCDETIDLAVCGECRRAYLEVEEDGEEHERAGPDYWVRGPIPPRTFGEILKAVDSCSERSLRLCGCTGHERMERYMYKDWVSIQPGTRVRPLTERRIASLASRDRPAQRPAHSPTPTEAARILKTLKKAAPGSHVTQFRTRGRRDPRT